MLTEVIFTAIYIFLPAGVSNVTPIIVGKIPFFKNFSFPIDFYQTYRGKRVLGDHKTIRGFVSGTLMGIVTAYVLLFFYPRLQHSIILDLTNVNVFLYGFLAGFGALFGDSLESFFKRQRSIPSGKKWFPYDQIDYILGGLIFISLEVKLPVVLIIAILIVWFGIHLLSTTVGYFLNMKEKPV